MNPCFAASATSSMSRLKAPVVCGKMCSPQPRLHWIITFVLSVVVVLIGVCCCDADGSNLII